MDSLYSQETRDTWHVFHGGIGYAAITGGLTLTEALEKARVLWHSLYRNEYVITLDEKYKELDASLDYDIDNLNDEITCINLDSSIALALEHKINIGDRILNA